MGIFDFWKKEKARPDFSNVRSGGSSTASAAPAPLPQAGDASSPAASVDTHLYVVVKGDSLSKIATGQYGNAQKWRRIYEANRDLIKDPDLIYPGQQLRIPQ
jgi:nucleoid-associated protein YgaU